MNVIVIVTDSLRADHVGCHPTAASYHGKKVQTPNLDRLAAEGTLFTHAYSESLPTMPTRHTWWTGRVGFPFRGWQPFENSDYTLAEILWDRGFTSALITDVYHMHKPVYNCGRGFDTVVWVRGQEYDPWVVEPLPVDLDRWHRLRGDESDALWKPRFEQYLRNRDGFREEEDWFAPRVTKEAIRWIEDTVQSKGQKDNLFLWVDYFDPHEPWDPPEPYWDMYRDPSYTGQDIIDPVAGPTGGYLSASEVERVKSLYAGEVTFVDKWIGVLLEAVRDNGLDENTLIVHLSDHGEPFGEHGIIRKARPWAYEELARVPWIMRLPGGEHGGRLSDGLVQPTDLLPTLLDALDIRGDLVLPYTAPRRTAQLFPQDMTLDQRGVRLHGSSLLPILRGEASSVRDFAYTGHHEQQWAIRNHIWTLLLGVREGANRLAERELYERRNDPSEQENRAEDLPEVVDMLELQLFRWARSLV
ncbi:sulfatase [Candidatus Poribacteria bacterium]|nr:sulfatase [Candidatus Poribacteria bacterium]